MFRLQLHVKALSDRMKYIEPGVMTKRFHAFLLLVIHKIDPDLSQYLHERKSRQLFSFFINRDQIMVHSPNKQVIQCLLQGLMNLSLIHLRDWRGKIQEIHCKHIMEKDISNAFSNYLTLYFLTPTTFYQSGNYYPLPELNRLLKSANKAYEMCENYAVPADIINTIAQTIRIEQVSLETKKVHFDKFKVLGFHGRMDMNLKALTPTDQQTAWKLFVYGSLMGIGYKTAWGLGQTRLEPFERTYFPTTYSVG